MSFFHVRAPLSPLQAVRLGGWPAPRKQLKSLRIPLDCTRRGDTRFAHTTSGSARRGRRSRETQPVGNPCGAKRRRYQSALRRPFLANSCGGVAANDFAARQSAVLAARSRPANIKAGSNCEAALIEGKTGDGCSFPKLCQDLERGHSCPFQPENRSADIPDRRFPAFRRSGGQECPRPLLLRGNPVLQFGVGVEALLPAALPHGGAPSCAVATSISTCLTEAQSSRRGIRDCVFVLLDLRVSAPP